MERIFVGLDLENLLSPARRGQRLEEAIESLVRTVAQAQGQGVAIGGTAVGDADLQRQTAWALDEVGIRVHAPLRSGADASDFVLLDHLTHYLPASTTAVLIGSGDHIFAPVARALTRLGLKVSALSLRGAISSELYRAVDTFTPLTPYHQVPAAA